MKRRAFLGSSTAALLSSQRVMGANERLRIALIGCGGRGRNVSSYVKDDPNAEIVAVSDVYTPRLEEASKQFSAEAIKDYRKILERQDIQGVIIGTPDHWHTPMTLEAVSAGKDVYVEKPVTRDLAEGAQLIGAVEKSGRVVATGTQQRSWPHYLEAKDLVTRRDLGRVTFVRCYWYQDYGRFRAAFDQAPPVGQEHLDWNAWLGAAPKQPFDPVKFRFWRFFWDFGGGVFTDLLTHWIDVIQWYLDTPKPITVHAGGATHKHDWMQAPDTVTTTLQYPGATVLFHGAMTAGLEGGGIIFRGDKAMMKLTRQGFAIYPEGVAPFEDTGLPEPTMRVNRDDGTLESRLNGNGTRNNVLNWLECMRTRAKPNADVVAGVEAAQTSHWANQAMRQQKVLVL